MKSGEIGDRRKLVEMMLDSFFVGLLVVLQTFQSGMVKLGHLVQFGFENGVLVKR